MSRRPFAELEEQGFTRPRRRKPFERYGLLLTPAESEAPVLARPVRSAVHAWLGEIQYGDELAQVGLKPRNSAMLSGPPGCGKTTLAHHLAARLGMPLLLIDTTALISKYVGQTGEQIGDLFRAIREAEEEIVLFLDEFDALAHKRVKTDQTSAVEKNNIVIAMLQQLDRNDTIWLAATNRRDNIDAAIWRRFGMHLELGLPDDEGRFAILKRYLAPFEVPDGGLDLLCAMTEGATPALLRQLMEGIKRELVLGARFDRPMDARSVVERVAAALSPIDDLPAPPLWESFAACAPHIERLPWPPERAG